MAERDALAEEVVDLRMDLGRKADAATVQELLAWREETAAALEHLEDNLNTLQELLSNFSARAMRDLDALREEGEQKLPRDALKPLERRLEKVEERLEQMAQEMGVGEVPELGKVPVGILELVYRTTLDDAATELRKRLGPEDAERIVAQAVEEVRTRMGGAELFRVRGGRITADGLAKAVDGNLVSARQAHATYEELLRLLTSKLPTYAPKNFRAMIKIKSQEYAVEQAFHGAKEAERLHAGLSRVEQDVKTLSTDLAERLSDAEKTVRGLAEAVRSAPTAPDLASLHARQDTLEKGLAELAGALDVRITKLQTQLESLARRRREGEAPHGRKEVSEGA